MLNVPRRGTEARRGLTPVLSPQVLMFSVLWVAINLVAGLAGFAIGGEVQSIAWQAHLGGYFVGLFLAGPFDRWAGKSDRERPQAA
jgi:membrane associated rhomboid family serine protease